MSMFRWWAFHRSKRKGKKEREGARMYVYLCLCVELERERMRKTCEHGGDFIQNTLPHFTSLHFASTILCILCMYVPYACILSSSTLFPHPSFSSLV